MTKTTIIKSHTPRFKGDAPSDWVPGAVTRHRDDCKWWPWKPIQKLGWIRGYVYEYEVEVEEKEVHNPDADEELANRIFADIKEMKDRGFYFVGKKNSVNEFMHLDEIEIRKCITYKGY